MTDRKTRRTRCRRHETLYDRIHAKERETFFTILNGAGVTHLIDVRLSNLSQLAGFTKRDDLAYFARTICGVPYTHMQELAPTENILKAVKKNKGSWGVYERKFSDLMAERKIEKLDRSAFDGACLLCSEPAPHQCHRRLVAEYLGERWKSVSITHL